MLYFVPAFKSLLLIIRGRVSILIPLAITYISKPKAFSNLLYLSSPIRLTTCPWRISRLKAWSICFHSISSSHFLLLQFYCTMFCVQSSFLCVRISWCTFVWEALLRLPLCVSFSLYVCLLICIFMGSRLMRLVYQGYFISRVDSDDVLWKGFSGTGVRSVLCVSWMLSYSL